MAGHGASLTQAIHMLELDGVVEGVSRFNMFNPFRAMQIRNDQREAFIPQQQIITGYTCQ